MKGCWLLHELNNNQIIKKYLCQQHNLLFFSTVITFDEKWVPLINQEQQWLSSGQKRSGTDFRIIVLQKWCFVYNRTKRPYLLEISGKSQNINAIFYCEQLDRVQRKTWNRRISALFMFNLYCKKYNSDLHHSSIFFL